MKQLLSICLTVVLLIGGVVGGLFYMQNYEDFYYVQVDNSSVKELSADSDMNYEYTLNSYNDKGSRKKLNFKTSRQLKEGAYLRLQVRSFGVHAWEEVSYDDLPEKVQNKIAK